MKQHYLPLLLPLVEACPLFLRVEVTAVSVGDRSKDFFAIGELVFYDEAGGRIDTTLATISQSDVTWGKSVEKALQWPVVTRNEAWESDVGSWVQLKFTEPQCLAEYDMYLDCLVDAPTGWVVQVSQDGSSWEVADTQTNVVWASGLSDCANNQKKRFSLPHARTTTTPITVQASNTVKVGLVAWLFLSITLVQLLHEGHFAW